VVECTALEMRHRCKPIGGSNPSLSAKKSVFLVIGQTLKFFKSTVTLPLTLPRFFWVTKVGPLLKIRLLLEHYWA
jgi:hypothetical protein